MIQIDLNYIDPSLVVMGNFLRNPNALLDFSNPVTDVVRVCYSVRIRSVGTFKLVNLICDLTCRTTSVLVLGKQVTVEQLKNVRD